MRRAIVLGLLLMAVGAALRAQEPPAAEAMIIRKAPLPLSGFATVSIPSGAEALYVTVHADPPTELILWLRIPTDAQDLQERRFYVARTPPSNVVHQVGPKWRFVSGFETDNACFTVFEEPRP